MSYFILGRKSGLSSSGSVNLARTAAGASASASFATGACAAGASRGCGRCWGSSARTGLSFGPSGDRVIACSGLCLLNSDTHFDLRGSLNTAQAKETARKGSLLLHVNQSENSSLRVECRRGLRSQPSGPSLFLAIAVFLGLQLQLTCLTLSF